MSRRVVVTGLGVVAPNGTDVPAFLASLKLGTSGLRFIPAYRELHFNCQVSGEPAFEIEGLKDIVSPVVLHGLKSKVIAYALKAASEAWADAGLTSLPGETHWDTGCVFAGSATDTGIIKNVIAKVDAGEARKLGSRVVEQLMGSGAAAYVSGLLGLGNRVMSTSAACATGSQAVLMGYEYIKHGLADRMLTGSAEYIDPYIFGAFDSMRILSRKFNNEPARASRPMSATAGGFVPGSGAAALVLEEREHAIARNATIYAEILGGAHNSGGQRGGGTMTAPGREGVVRCIAAALKDAAIAPADIDLISGHLTGTGADVFEIENWAAVLSLPPGRFPFVNSLKSMVGHCLSAAGSIEIVAVILQIIHGFIHANKNLEDPNPVITAITGTDALPVKTIDKQLAVVAKANFGFGDVNTCLFFSKHI